MLTGLAGCGPAGRAPAIGPAPSSGVAPAAASLERGLQRDLAEHHAVAWSAERRLQWSDFQAPPPRGGAESARTGYGLYYGWRCRRSAFEFQVIAAFHPRESWVKAEVVQDSVESRRTLAHEQTHFDIAEVHARRMRRYFRGLTDPCAQSDAALDADAARLLEQEKATQRRYDTETRHGLELRVQRRWQADIGQELAGRD